MERDEGEQQAARQLDRALVWIVGFGLFVLGLALYALHLSQLDGANRTLGIGGLVFLTAAAVGGALGFLFAVPRVLSQPSGVLAEEAVRAAAAPGAEPAAAGQPAERQKSRARRARMLGSNTNLERISDWLTTMLVGVGLSQINEIPAALNRFGIFLCSLSGCAAGPSGAFDPADLQGSVLPLVGPMILVFGLITGFLFLYLFTRLKLVSLLNAVEYGLEGELPPGEELVGDKAGRAVVDAISRLDKDSENPGFKKLVAGKAPSVDESLNVMLNLLYRTEGYQEVINLGGRLSNSAATKIPEYWFYLAAAFGQKHHVLKVAGADAAELASARDNAFDCARRAIDLDVRFRRRLWDISDPNSVDNDLADFRDDPAFQRLTGTA